MITGAVVRQGEAVATPGSVVVLEASGRPVLPSHGSSAHSCDGHHSILRKDRSTLANIKSQKKRVLTNAKAAAKNKSVRTSVKTAVKKVNEAIVAGDKA